MMIDIDYLEPLENPTEQLMVSCLRVRAAPSTPALEQLPRHVHKVFPEGWSNDITQAGSVEE